MEKENPGRALPVAKRLRVAERIVHEAAEEVTPVPETAAARQRDVLEVLDALPPGTRTKDDIDRQMADERASWTEPLTVALEAPHELSQTLPMGDPAVDISDLTPQQRLELIEQLWDSLTPDEVPLTPAQSAELQRRLDRLDREGVSGRSWDEVERRVRGAR